MYVKSTAMTDQNKVMNDETTESMKAGPPVVTPGYTKAQPVTEGSEDR